MLMSFSVIRTSNSISMDIMVIGVLICDLLLYIRLTNLFNPDLSDAYLTCNIKVCMLGCITGLLNLQPEIPALRENIHNKCSESIVKNIRTVDNWYPILYFCYFLFLFCNPGSAINCDA